VTANAIHLKIRHLTRQHLAGFRQMPKNRQLT
jgi:hypothetical protein